MKGKSRIKLIEAAIAVLSLAAVISAITLGLQLQDMLRIHSQAADIKNYEMAYHAFKLQYRAMPGDLSGATTYWKDAPEVKNGDGNGTYADTDFQHELGQVFVHLHHAGLLGTAFDGSFRLKQGYPEVQLAHGKGMVIGGKLLAGDAADMELQKIPKPRAAMYLSIARPEQENLSDSLRGAGLFDPGLLAKLDLKMDDSRPRKGRLIGYRAPGTKEQGACLEETSYNIENVIKNCSALYLYEF